MKQALFFGLLVLVGCGKSGSDAESAAAARNSAIDKAPATDAVPAMRQTAPVGTPAAAAAQAMNEDLMSSDPEANLRVLNQLVGGFTMSNNRLPADLEDLVKAKLISRVPPAPPGKKFVIDRKSSRVILADH
ncbi:hypothetical protein LBMAG56_33100 [Verrucomicrobiota bacterium]|nr:hypothetical protein LBMAG56_33100 [Verrucomicrobiota bacterium]